MDTKTTDRHTSHPHIAISSIVVGRRIRNTPGDIRALADSMNALGMLHPVVVNGSHELVAGLRRLAAARHLGWSEVPHVVVTNLADACGILKAELAENTCRMDFSPSEAGAMADALLPLERQAAESRLKSHTKSGYVNFPDAGAASDKVAAVVGYSRPTLRKIQEIRQAAEGNPEFKKIVADMDRTGNVDAAYKRLVKAIREGELRKREEQFDQEARRGFDAVCQIQHNDFHALLTTLADGPEEFRPNAIICDPPYTRGLADLYESLSLCASRALKPGGIVAVLCGQTDFPAVFNALLMHMPYRWILNYEMGSGKSVKIHSNRILMQTWKPIVVVGGNERWIGTDVIRVTDLDKTFHPWQQCPVGFQRLIELLTDPNDIVCDPFVCTGTTAIAAIKAKRRFVGCDIDASMVPIARQRALEAWDGEIKEAA